MTMFDINSLFLNILSLSLSGALAGMLILLIRPLTGKFFSRKWNYYIWFLVIIRLLLPVQFTADMPGTITFHMNLAQREKAVEAAWQTAAENAPKEALEGTAEAASEEAAGRILEGASGEVSEEALAPALSLKTVLLLTAEAIWILGAAAALCFKLWNYYRYVSFIKKDAHPVTDSRIMVPAQSMSARLHMRTMPPVYESSSVSGPVTLGLWKPVIILPKTGCGLMGNAPEQNRHGWNPSERNPLEQNPSVQYQLILHHELVHVARRDLWYKWLYQFLLCIHWFNPFLYLIERKMSMDCELSCDETVLADLTAEGRKAYGNVLLDIAEQNTAAMKSAFTTTFVTGKSGLKKRLNSILHYKRTTVPRLLLSVCVMAGTIFLTACGNVYFGYEDFGSDDKFWEDDSAYGEHESFWDNLWEMGQVDLDGEAYQVYDDAALLSGADLSDKWQAYNYTGGSNKVTMSKFVLNGSYSLRIVYAAEDTEIEVTSCFDLKEGRFKVVHIAPDGTISTLNDTGEKNTMTVAMPRGRNVIKIVGQAAKLKDAEISFSGLKGKSFESVYYSEEDEYAGMIMDAVRNGTVEKDKLMKSLYYMKEEDISEAFAELLKQGTIFDEDELTDIFIYSDAESSGDYLADAIGNGLIEPLSVDTLSTIMVYLEGSAKTELINALPEEEFLEGLEECIFYLSEKEMEECLLAYIDAGGRLSYEQFADIEMYLSRSTIKKMDERMALPADAGEPE